MTEIKWVLLSSFESEKFEVASHEFTSNLQTWERTRRLDSIQPCPSIRDLIRHYSILFLSLIERHDLYLTELGENLLQGKIAGQKGPQMRCQLEKSHFIISYLVSEWFVIGKYLDKKLSLTQIRWKVASEFGCRESSDSIFSQTWTRMWPKFGIHLYETEDWLRWWNLTDLHGGQRWQAREIRLECNQ